MAKASAQRMLAYVRLLQGNHAAALSAATQALQVGDFTCSMQMPDLAAPCPGQSKSYFFKYSVVLSEWMPCLNQVYWLLQTINSAR